MKVLDLHKELNALGIRFEPIGWVKAPAYPYGVYVDDVGVTQPDTPDGVRIVRHEVTVEMYHPDLDALKKSAKILEAWINSIPLNYRMRHTFIIDENHYCVTYSLSYSNTERDV